MITLRHLRRPAALAAGIAATGALAAFGSSPAFATDSQIYGSGGAIQNQLENDITIPDWHAAAPTVNTPDPIFTATTANAGFTEFGNGTGSFDFTQDPTADALSPAELDTYVATDSPATGPLSTTGSQLYEANQASKAGGATGTDEIVVPIAQVPLDVLLSLPAGITLNSSQTLSLTNELVDQIYAGTVPAWTSTPTYSKDTWGALLSWLGLTKITSGSPTVGQFLDSGGGSTTIDVEVRKNGAGATLNVKNYVSSVDALGKWSNWGSTTIDDNAYGTSEWPSGATINASPGNSTDATEVLAVDGTPGNVGYGTAGDAAYNTTPFTDEPTSSTDAPTVGGTKSASHQILYALVQDNGVAGDNDLSTDKNSGTPEYANPEGSGSSGNLYTGADININGGDSSWVGSWTVPSNFKTGTWYPTEGSDPDVYDHSGASTTYYGLESVLWALSWNNFADLPSSVNYTADAAATTASFIQWEVSSTGQSDINSSYYYNELPSAILTDAQTAASDVG
jgi:hypothetical protein